MMFKCPVCNDYSYELVKKIPTIDIKNALNRSLQIDVARFFMNISEIEEYRCILTGYRFFYPYNIAADDSFYKQLQNFPWYYQSNKWEYTKCLETILNRKTLLEIGCGQGDFLQKAKQKGCDAIGLEINKEAAMIGNQRGLRIENAPFLSFAEKNPAIFDYVCSFHVLEHIWDVRSFFYATLKCLAPAGKLLIAVPNNDSFLGLDNNVLNIPPHHMGLWNGDSLKNLEKVFPIKVNNIFYEPLQNYHKDYYAGVVNVAFKNYLIKKLGFSGRLLHYFFCRTRLLNLQNGYERKLKMKYPTFENFTVLVELEKC